MMLPALVAVVGPATASAATREYWVAAVPTRWNPVVNGMDAIGGTHYDPAQTTFPTVTFRRFTRGWRQPLRGCSMSETPSAKALSSAHSVTSSAPIPTLPHWSSVIWARLCTPFS